jgi:hypothetical protein
MSLWQMGKKERTFWYFECTVVDAMGIVVLALFAWSSLFASATNRAVIVDSGSTNTAGFRIVVKPSGEAEYTPLTGRSGRQTESQASPRSQKIEKDLVQRFYSELESSRPLSKLPRHGCFKSASFGTTLTVEFDGEKSPDLSCGDHGDPKLKRLVSDVNKIVKRFQ